MGDESANQPGAARPVTAAADDGFAPLRVKEVVREIHHRAADSATEHLTIELDRRSTTVAYRPGNTVLQTARSAGLHAPSSCETGSCGTCMARVIEGSARMINNDALDED